MMQITIDQYLNSTYFNYSNVRVGIKRVPKGDPKNWANVDRYLQIMAHRNATGTTTFPGPQIPISDDEKRSDEDLLNIMMTALKAIT